MKSLLKINFYLFIIFLSFFIVMGKSYDTQLYTNFFKDSGFKFDIFNKGDKESLFNKTSQNIFIETFSQPDNIFLVNVKDFNYKMVFFVCNSNYTENNLFRCTTSEFEYLKNVNYKYEEIVLFNSDKDEKTSVHLITSQDTAFFIVNENEFGSSNKKELLSSYFKGINRSLNVSVENPNVTEKTFRQNFEVFLNSTTFEFITFGLVALLFLTIFGKIVIYLRSNIKNLNFLKLKHLVEETIFGYFSKNIYAKTFISVIFIFYIFLFIQYIQEYPGSKTLFFKEMIVNVINFNFFDNLSKSDYPKLVFFTFTYFIFFLILLTRIGVFIELVQAINSKFKSSKIIFKNLKYCFVILYTLSLVLFVNFINTLSFEFFIYLIILNLLLFSIFYKSGVGIYSLFNLKEKILIIITSIFFPLVVFLFQTFFFSPNFISENLIGINDSIVVLPYKKQSYGNFIFNNLNEYNINYSLFIEEYLIYSNKFETVENKSFKNFNDSNSNFIVTGKTKERLIRALLSKPEVLPLLSNYESNKYIYLDNRNHNEVSLRINVNCLVKSSSSFNLRIYYFENPKNFVSSEYNLGNLIGCNEESKEYVFKLPNELAFQNDIIIELLDKNPKFIKSLLIVNSENSENIEFKKLNIINNLYFYVTSNSLLDSGKITNYFVNNKKEYSFESKNITENLNQLVKDKSIGNVFNIWSLEPYRLIVNEFDSK